MGKILGVSFTTTTTLTHINTAILSLSPQTLTKTPKSQNNADCFLPSCSRIHTGLRVSLYSENHYRVPSGVASVFSFRLAAVCSPSVQSKGDSFLSDLFVFFLSITALEDLC